MKHLLILFVASLLLSCDEQEVVNYPDCINRPDSIVQSLGCGNLFLYQFIDSSKVITVSLDANRLGLTKKCRAFNLSNVDPAIIVQLEIAGSSSDSVYFNFCNDVMPPNFGVTKKLKATSGQLFVSSSEDSPFAINQSYRVSIKLKDLRLYDSDNNQEIFFNEIIFWDVLVGFLPG
ncbi:hypothetical protein [Ignavibacterium album]|uniref:hypothetical protein n=1 Tax=Ignavibacterium album TaxID=591197 RepID=UPI0026EC3720|nr:hypothetical protein [Ignavibacterium album]